MTWAVTFTWSRLSSSPWLKAFRIALLPLAIGLNAGAVYVLGRSVLLNVPTVLIATATVAVLLCTKIAPAYVMLGAAAVGAFVLQP